MTDAANAEGTTDTIAAIATARGQAGVGVVRVSGPCVPDIATALLGQSPHPRHAHFTRFRDGGGRQIDQGLLLYFPKPHSFTGEAVVELQVHGSDIVLHQLLQRVCRLGARLAGPGEFSERAFLNGKLDLVQAEAIADLIAARSAQAARAAQRSLEGAFSRRVQVLQDALVDVRVHIEAAIDFPQEEIDFLADHAITDKLEAVQSTIATLLHDARQGVRLTDGLGVVIIGRPNVGKSSLLNALSNSDRAIVTAQAGTTRDVLREVLDIDGVSIELLDTAGLRDSDDEIEREGVRRARHHAAQADLVILVSDEAAFESDRHLLDEIPQSAARLVVVNKIDLSGSNSGEKLVAGVPHVRLSARTGDGIDILKARLKRLAGAAGGEGGAFSARRRHVLALESTAGHVAAARHVLVDAGAGELAAEELREAQQDLGEITGSYCPDDLLGAIFSSFCIGK